MTAEKVMDKAFDYKGLAACIAAGRKDELIIDFARLLSAHYGKMVEHFSNGGVPAHNNKTLFLEAADVWCRKNFAPITDRAAMGLHNHQSWGSETEDPREVVEYYMTPWYESLKLEDPSLYRMRNMGAPPLYVGSAIDATCMMLSICASVDVTPIMLRMGKRDGKVARIWGKIQADGNVYDSDINDSMLVLGEHHEFDDYDEAEVPL